MFPTYPSTIFRSYGAGGAGRALGGTHDAFTQKLVPWYRCPGGLIVWPDCGGPSGCILTMRRGSNNRADPNVALCELSVRLEGAGKRISTESFHEQSGGALESTKDQKVVTEVGTG